MQPSSSDSSPNASAARSNGCASLKSFHVATLDYERADLEAAAVAFARRVVGSNRKELEVLQRSPGDRR